MERKMKDYTEERIEIESGSDLYNKLVAWRLKAHNANVSANAAKTNGYRIFMYKDGDVSFHYNDSNNDLINLGWDANLLDILKVEEKDVELGLKASAPEEPGYIVRFDVDDLNCIKEVEKKLTERNDCYSTWHEGGFHYDIRDHETDWIIDHYLDKIIKQTEV
jgi:hypothetical protein